jgi:hypothetical protein
MSSRVAVLAALVPALFGAACAGGDNDSNSSFGGSLPTNPSSVSVADTGTGTTAAATEPTSSGTAAMTDPALPDCGDGMCLGQEYCVNCPQDCMGCEPVCGDTMCNGD